MIPLTQPDVVWHFGCTKGRTGHYATSQPGRTTHLDASGFTRLRTWIEGLDGRLHDDNSDRWLTHWLEAADGSQMTFIARRDRSVDARPGSWCGFLMPGNSPLPTALRIAQEAFPNLEIWRITGRESV